MPINVTPTVSVITVCFNAEKTIRRTIESVLAQTYDNIEYIIIDGSSTDGTLNIIAEYDGQISKVLCEVDHGISDAFNKGIRLATGEFVQILNSDDYLQENKIKNSVRVLIDNPNYGYCFCDIILLDRHENHLFRIQGDPKYYRSIKYSMPRINHPTVTSRMAMFQRYGCFNKIWKYAMDYDWLLRLHKNMVSGIYSPDLVVFMQDGGESSKNLLKTEREQVNISIHNGYSPIKANVLFLLKAFKIAIRKFASIIFPQQWIFYFRPGKLHLKTRL